MADYNHITTPPNPSTGTSQFFIDPGIIQIKQEQPDLATDLLATTLSTSPFHHTTTTTTNVTASVPIPQQRNQQLQQSIGELRYFELTSNSQGSHNNDSPSYHELTLMDQILKSGGDDSQEALMCAEDVGGGMIMHMDDDDIFQVDKADLIQGPTLAELNANDDILFTDFNFDDLLLPDENRMIFNGIKFGQHTNHSLTSAIGFNNNNSNSSSGTMFLGSSCPQSALSSQPSFTSNPHQARGNFNDSGINLSGGGSSLASGAALFSGSNSGISGSLGKVPPISYSPRSDSMGLSNSPQMSLYGAGGGMNAGGMSPSVSPVPGGLSSLQQKHSTLHELLLKKDLSNPALSPGPSGLSPQSSNTPLLLGSPSVATLLLSQNSHMRNIPQHLLTSAGKSSTSNTLSTSRLSSSAPTHLGLEQIWQRREPRKHLLSTGSLAEAGSTSSLSTGGVLSPEAPDFSHDELEDDSDEEEDSHYEDFSSDNANSDDDDDTGPMQRPRASSSPGKKERFFWQYNVQAKGPKGQRLVLKTKMENPHILNEITDPVFSTECVVRGIKHSGKARKGDGNDLTPNPRKLHNIGKELDKLGRVINEMTPVSELPFNVRPKTRKEKNKLASRACRLKKKAQHEANKIKLQGLENEHRRLMHAISQVKQLMTAKVNDPATFSQSEELQLHLDKIYKSCLKLKIAGQTTLYVNKILEKYKGVDGTSMNMENYM